MPSSEARTPNYSRRFLWLAVFIVVLFGGYSLAWYYAAGWIRDFAVAQIASLDKEGKSADCANTTARGYPFRMGLFCDSVRFDDPATRFSATAGAFRSAAQVYDPYHIVAELDGPATISTSGESPLAFDWKNLRASVRLDTDFPDRVDAETDGFAAGASGQSGLLGFGHAEVHMRRNGEDLDLAASLADTSIAPQLTPGTQLPPFAAEADLTIRNGVAWARAGAKGLRGRSGTIRTLALSLDPATGLSLTGSFAIADDCLLSADLKLVVRNPKVLGEQLAKAVPANADQFRMVFSAMPDNTTWPLKISNGKVMFGAISIPPLCGPGA